MKLFTFLEIRPLRQAMLFEMLCHAFEEIINAYMHESVNIGINNGFQCSNIRWITRKVFEHKAAGRVFKPLPSDPAND